MMEPIESNESPMTDPRDLEPHALIEWMGQIIRSADDSISRWTPAQRRKARETLRMVNTTKRNVRLYRRVLRDMDRLGTSFEHTPDWAGRLSTIDALEFIQRQVAAGWPAVL